MAQMPEDPEPEMQQQLYNDFLLLGFTKGEALQLAVAHADPVRVSWWLEQGCTHKKAVAIAT